MVRRTHVLNSPVGKIGDMLVDDGLVSRRQIEDALSYQASHGGKTAECLIRLGALHTRDYFRFLASLPGVASMHLENYSFSKGIEHLLPIEYMRAKEVFPIDHMGNSLTLGMACPLDKKTVDEVSEMTGLRVHPMFVDPEEIQQTICRYFRAPGSKNSMFDV
jgi:hypothetical protein